MSIFSVIARQFAVPLRNCLSDTCILWQVKPKAAPSRAAAIVGKGGGGRRRTRTSAPSSNRIRLFEGRNVMSSSLSRRTLIKSAAGSAVLAGVGMPAIVRAQADAIRIGHLTPLTGFLGPLGEYAVMGVKLAADEINDGGGVMGRKIELVMEDSVNPQTASAKAERLIERDKVAMIIGEISSASGLAIGQVANRLKTVFINTGCNSDALRGASCNPYMFHIEGANSMYVMAVGQYLLRENLVRGKKWYSLTADYAFGHDLLRVAKKFMEANGGQFAADELVPTDATDFS